MLAFLKKTKDFFSFSRQKTATKKAPPNHHSELEKFLASPLENIMIPRSDIVAISSQVPFADVVQTFLKTGFQWLPVYRETLDHIIGVISIHGAISLQHADTDDKKWCRHLSPVFFAPASMTVQEALLRFYKDHKASCIFIVDEYGGIEGMLTKGQTLSSFYLHDCMDEEEDMIFSHEPVLVISGRMDVKMFEEELGIEGFFSQEDLERVNTLGGWLCSLVGRVPLNGETITHPSGFVFEIRQADPRRIHKIALLQKPPCPGESSSSPEAFSN